MLHEKVGKYERMRKSLFYKTKTGAKSTRFEKGKANKNLSKSD